MSSNQRSRPLIPELSPEAASPIRIPGELDVPVTARIRRLLDLAAMQRLRRISQLGLVSQVYPGATHSRFEHSLGVYRLGCQVLSHLLSVEKEFAEEINEQDALVFLLAAILHDVGHWPYCHPIEDLHLPHVVEHEQLARHWICDSEVADVIASEFGLKPPQVAAFIAAEPQPSRALQVLRNVMDGPVDIDKMDYLQRDSLHAGVPYGRNFDVGRLVASMRIGQDGQRLAITEKGKTAAEMLVFARYVMFSEVYWHHAVRSATAMLQRLVFELGERLDTSQWAFQSDFDFQSSVLHAAAGEPGLEELATSLFGSQRRLYKRFAQFSHGEDNGVHALLAGRPFTQLVELATELSLRLSRLSGINFRATDLLIDAAPVKREVQFRMNVWVTDIEQRELKLVPMSSISPVVNALATEQFDHFVKRVRVYIAPDRLSQVQVSVGELAAWIREIASSWTP